MPAHLCLDNLACLELLLKLAPRALLAGAVEREDRMALVVLGLHNRHEHRVTYLHGVALFLRKALKLMAGDNALGLGSDIDEDFVATELHYGAFDDVAMLERAVLLLRGLEEV